VSAPARLIATVVVTALLAGCGSDDEPSKPGAGPTRTVVKTVTQSSTSTVATEIAVRHVDVLTGFSSPSGNVGCYIDKRNVRCDIRQRAWKPSPKPSSCELDFGQGIALSAGAKPGFVCAGDTALGAGAKLAYGEGIQAGVLRCSSRSSGMTCQDTETGRGFSLSRERYEIF